MRKQIPKITKRDIIKSGFPLVDYHIHADYADADLHIRDIVKVAYQKGLNQIAITEHIWRGVDWVSEYIERIEMFNRDENFVLIGAEARILNMEGDMNIDQTVIDKFDVIIGSLHRYPEVDIENSFGSKCLSVKEAVEIEEEALIAMIRQRKVDVIGHIGRSFEKLFPGTVFPINSIKRVVLAAKKADIAVEINAGSKNALDVFSCCIILDCPMSFGTDSHSLDTIGEYNKRKFLDDFEKLIAVNKPNT